MTLRAARRVSWRTLVRAADPEYDLVEPTYEFTGRTFYKRVPLPGKGGVEPEPPEPGPEPPPVGEPQVIYTGIRVVGVDIPQNAAISASYLELTSTGTFPEDGARLVIRGELSGNPVDYSAGNPPVTARQTTSAYANWEPVPWMGKDLKYQTPDLSAILGEIVEIPAWEDGNPMNFIIMGTGYREFYSDMAGDSSKWPKLVAAWAGPALIHNGDVVTHNGDIVIGL